MRVLFVLKQRNYLGTFAGVVQRLTDRAHEVVLAWPDHDLTLPEGLSGNARVTVRQWTPRRGDRWESLAGTIRRGSDYLRYLQPRFRGAVKLRARAFNQLLHSLSNGRRGEAPSGDVGLILTEDELDKFTAIGRATEDAIPSDFSHEQFILAASPDVVLVSPLIDLGSAQTDIIKAARRLGIPTGMILYSWDNLSTKGGLHCVPDRMFVWNELQRREASDLHGYPVERTHAVGAPRFDEFFELAASIPRDAFCEGIGFDPGRPILLYFGSSKFVSGNELEFIRRWTQEIREHSSRQLREANILIRPHPDIKLADHEGPVEIVRWPNIRQKGWISRPTGYERVAILRTKGAAGLYEALFHSAAVVALNTSAAVEAAIVGRPVFTLIAGDDLADGQHTTLHFHYLLVENGGCVTLAKDFDEHRAQLAAALDGPDVTDRLRSFAKEFVRPHGWRQPAAQVLVEAIEREYGSLARPSGRDAISAPQGARVSAGDGDILRLDFPAIDIWLRVSSDAERKWRACACAKEPWTVAWINEQVHAGEVFYDIGSNVGAFALLAAKYREAAVVAFEPGYGNFARLCENIQLNGCEGSVIPVPLPLAEKSGVVGFKYRSVDIGQSRHHLSDHPWHKQDARRRTRYVQPVCAVALDAAIAEFKLPRPNHLKIDVDGAELRVLQGATEVLRDAELKSILLEVDQAHWSCIESLLNATGFAVLHRASRDTKPDAPIYAVFARS